MGVRVIVSIIVPVYNGKEYLDRCVESILCQTYTEIEVVLVDDGSTDESGFMCDEYEKKDSRVRVIHKENGGLMSAWTAGVRQSTGRYLCFVDSDDWIESCMIEDMYRFVTFGKREVICCNHVIDRAGEVKHERHSLLPGIYEAGELQEVFKDILGNEHRKISMSRCMKLIARELILDNMHFCDSALRMGEDVNIILPILLDSKRVVIMEDSYYYHYFYNEASMVHRYDKGLYKNIKLLQKVIIHIFTEKVNKGQLDLSLEESEEQYGREYLFLLMLVLKNEARGNKESYTDNIKEICKKENTPLLLKTYPIKVEEKANKLLRMVMKYPNAFTIRILGLAMDIFYAGRK